MHIGLPTTSFPRFDGDVAGSFVLGFARALVARGHRVTVLAPEPLEPYAPLREGPLLETRFVPYVRPRVLARTFYGAGVLDNLDDPRAWPGLVTFPAALALAMRRELGACEAWISHFGAPCGLIASLLRGQRAHVAVLHSADLHALERVPAGSRLAALLVAGADRVTCVSQGARARLVGLLPQARRTELQARIEVQAMGLDTQRIAHSLANRERARASLDARGFTLVTLARLVPIKGLAEALDTLGQRDDVEWIIAGDGPLRAELTERAARCRARIRLVGQLDEAAKLDLLAAADALLLPSRVLPSGRAEGAPLAVLEAMAAALPVIASNTGGIAELVEHGRAGFLFDPAQPETLHAALARARDVRERAAVVARGAEIARAHDWHRIAARYERWLLPARYI